MPCVGRKPGSPGVDVPQSAHSEGLNSEGLESPEHEHDMRLIDSYLAGQVSALNALVDLHGRAVYSYIYRFLGSDSHIDDVYQDVWMRVVKSVKNFGGRSRFTTWLFQLTRNICIDHLRRRQRQIKALSINEAGGGDDDSPKIVPVATDEAAETIVERDELVVLLEKAIEQLPDEQREVLLLRRYTTMTFQDISEMSGVPRNTVKSRMRYALENIRRTLKVEKSGDGAGEEVDNND